MTKREAHKIAIRLAYQAVQKAVDAGGDEAANLAVDGGADEGATLADQIKIDAALDEIAQRLYERWKKHDPV